LSSWLNSFVILIYKLYIMATLANIEQKLANEPSFIGELMVDPQQALNNAGLQLESPNDTRRMERLVKSMQKQLAVAGEMAAFNPSARAEWGIGMGCCSESCLQEYNTTDGCS
jgi:Tfp pilus assembly protein PilO